MPPVISGLRHTMQKDDRTAGTGIAVVDSCSVHCDAIASHRASVMILHHERAFHTSVPGWFRARGDSTRDAEADAGAQWGGALNHGWYGWWKRRMRVVWG